MDRLSKLHALLGDGQVASTAAPEGLPRSRSSKPAHLYEGSDSDSEEEMMARGRVEWEQHQTAWAPTAGERTADVGTVTAAGEQGSIDQQSTQQLAQQPSPLADSQLEFGELADAAESFCPWTVLKKYPYAYVGVANRGKVVNGFWDAGKLLNESWDFFYIHRLESDNKLTPILLIPTEQVEAFLAKINQSLHIQLEIPSGEWGRAFRVTFDNDGTPRPRYLGRSTNKAMAENLHSAVLPRWYKHKGETETASTPTTRSVAAFMAKIDLMTQAQKWKKIASAEKKKVDRIAKQQSWSHTTKHVQRYLGIRKASNEHPGEALQAGEWGEYNVQQKADISWSADFDPRKAAPYDQESEVVFVCIDIEANERNSSQITEIGIATLDTRDVMSVAPGERGINWMNKIRARHIRIDEYKHIVNTEFISGCPGRFEFGESEFVKLKDAPRAVADCFKHPFSDLDDKSVIDPTAPKRNIIFVGHGVGADIKYLKTLGYDVHNLSNLQEIVDTALMWQGLKSELSPRSLGSVLAEIGIAGWNLHNAGNDAVYTLQAMIGISIKQLCDREKRAQDREQETKARVEESIKEPTQAALDKEERWSTGGENSDGGAPIAPVPPGTKNPVIQQSKEGSQYRDEPWRARAENTRMNSQHQGSNGSWRSTAVSGNSYGLATSYNQWRQVEQRSVQGPTFPGSTSTSLHGHTSTSAQGCTPTSLPGYTTPAQGHTPTCLRGDVSSPVQDFASIPLQDYASNSLEGSSPNTLPVGAATVVSGSTATDGWPKYAFPIDDEIEAMYITPAPQQTSLIQGTRHPGRTPTHAVVNKDGTKDVFHTPSGKKLFTISSSQAHPLPPPT